jgi:hypothetical protein
MREKDAEKDAETPNELSAIGLAIRARSEGASAISAGETSG